MLGLKGRGGEVPNTKTKHHRSDLSEGEQDKKRVVFTKSLARKDRVYYEELFLRYRGGGTGRFVGCNTCWVSIRNPTPGHDHALGEAISDIQACIDKGNGVGPNVSRSIELSTVASSHAEQ